MRKPPNEVIKVYSPDDWSQAPVPLCLAPVEVRAAAVAAAAAGAVMSLALRGQDRNY